MGNYSGFKKPHPMNRLLQGDVGSGKTIVAVLAALSVVRPFGSAQGKQVAFMAPTEVLAQQHYNTFKKIFLILIKAPALLLLQLREFFTATIWKATLKKAKSSKNREWRDKNRLRHPFAYSEIHKI